MGPSKAILVVLASVLTESHGKSLIALLTLDHNMVNEVKYSKIAYVLFDMDGKFPAVQC